MKESNMNKPALDNELYRTLVEDRRQVRWTEYHYGILVPLIMARIKKDPHHTPLQHLGALMTDKIGLPDDFPTRKIATRSNCEALWPLFGDAWRAMIAKADAPPPSPIMQLVEVPTPIPIDEAHLETSVPEVLIVGVAKKIIERWKSQATVEGITPYLAEKPMLPKPIQSPTLASILAPKPQQGKIKFLVAGLLREKQEKLQQKFAGTAVQFDFLEVGEMHSAKQLKKQAHHIFTINGLIQLNGIMRNIYGREVVTSRDTPDELIQAIWAVYSQKVAEAQRCMPMILPTNRPNGNGNGHHRNEAFCQ